MQVEKKSLPIVQLITYDTRTELDLKNVCSFMNADKLQKKASKSHPENSQQVHFGQCVSPLLLSTFYSLPASNQSKIGHIRQVYVVIYVCKIELNTLFSLELVMEVAEEWGIVLPSNLCWELHMHNIDLAFMSKTFLN